MSVRGHGKLGFGDLVDGSGKIQLLVSANSTSKKDFEVWQHLDRGDIIGVEGAIGKTKRGEVSILVKKLQILTKCLQPMPNTFFGVKDRELKYRRRYLDLIVNPQSRRVFEIRARAIDAMREFLNARGYLEVYTPILQPIYGGGFARPFITHHNTLNINMYLRISNEMYLKRLIAGGIERVYEFSPNFRNEGIDTTHNPEFTILEMMTAYSDYKDGMNLIEEIIKYAAKKCLGTTIVKYKGHKIDLGHWERITMVDSVKKYLSFDAEKASAAKLLDFAKSNHLKVNKSMPRGILINEIFEEVVQPKIIHPTIVYEYPIEVSALAKECRDKPGYTERFEMFVVGWELGNNYTELTNPHTIRKRFTEELKRGKAGDEEAHPVDDDFVLAMEYGMPPTCGTAIGLDRLFMLLTSAESIRDVILFPTLRPEEGVPMSKQINVDAPKTDVSKAVEGLILIDSAVKRKFPGLKVAAAVVQGVNVKKRHTELEKLKTKLIPKLRKNAKKLLADPKLREYVRIYKETGIDTSKRKPSPVAMLQRLADGKDLYNVNTVVDAYNLAVLTTRCSMGAFNLAKLRLPQVVRFSQQGELFRPLGEKADRRLASGELIYADTEKVVTRDLNYRDCNATKITEKTKDILLVVDGTKETTNAELKKALNLVIKSIMTYSGGKLVKKVFA